MQKALNTNFSKLINLYNSQKTVFSIIIISIIIILANSMPLLGILPKNPIDYRLGLSSEQKAIVFDGQHTIDPNDGFTSQALGKQASEKLLDFKIPLWNEFEGIGFPLAAGMQSAALFPLVILHTFENGILYIQLILQLVAGIGTYLFLRKLTINNLLAISGGVAYGLCGTMAWLHNAAFNPVAFLPLLLLGVEQIYLSTRKKKPLFSGWVLLSLSLALSIYSGFPETVFIYCVLPLGWAVIRYFDLAKEFKLEFIKKIIIGGLVGLLLAAPIIILFIHYISSAHTGEHGGALASFGLDIYALPALVMPYIYGPIFGNLSNSSTLSFWSNVGGYMQLSVFILAFFALFNKIINKKITIFFAVVSLVFLARIYGFPFMAEIINLIPGFSLVAFYRYAFPGLIFAMIVLAVIGVDGFLKLGKKKSIISLSVIYCVIYLLIVIGSKISLNAAGNDIKKLYLFSILLAFIVMLAIVFSKLLSRRGALILLSTLIIFESFLLFIIPQFSTKSNELELGSVKFLQDNLERYRFYTLGPIEPNYGSYFNIASINNNDLPVPKNWAEYINNRLNNKTDPILFTGNYSSDGDANTPLNEFITNIENYKNLGAKYLVVDRDFPNQDILINNKLSLKYSDNIVNIYEIPNPSKYFEIVKGNCDIQALSKTELNVNCSEDSVLLRRELFMAGWNANKVPVEPAGDYDIFQITKLKKGQQIVKYSYSPPFLGYGIFLFSIGALAIVGSLIYGYSINRKGKNNG